MVWVRFLPLLFGFAVTVVGIHTVYTREKTLRFDIWNTRRHSDDIFLELSGVPAVIVGMIEIGIGLGFLIMVSRAMLAQP